MPPLSETRPAQSSPTRHTSSGAAAANASHDEDDREAAMREALTNFVTDTMYDKPENLLQYMAEWAQKQQSARAKQQRTLSPTPPPPRVSATSRHAARGASTEPEHVVKAPEAEHQKPANNTASQIMTLAQQRQRHFRDKAQGSRDHYLMSLEDSDGDIFHVNGLQKKMMASRKDEMDAKADTAAVASRLEEIAQSEDSEDAKAQRLLEMLHTYQRLWKNDLPAKHKK